MGEPGRSYQPKTDPGPVPPELVARDGENTNPTRSWSIAPGSLRREIAAAYARIAELESQVADERWQTPAPPLAVAYAAGSAYLWVTT